MNKEVKQYPSFIDVVGPAARGLLQRVSWRGLAYIAMERVPGTPGTLFKRGAIMQSDFARLYAGHMGVCAVILNVLIDKCLISPDELRGRFEQARDAAAQRSGGPETAAVLAEIVHYLDRDAQRHH